MIVSFRSKSLRRFYEDDDHGGLRRDVAQRVGELLALLDAATTIEGMSAVTCRLRPLKDEHKGFWAVSVRGDWWMIFHFEDGKASDVDEIGRY